MKKIIVLIFAILALSAYTPEEAFIGGTLAGIIVSDASNERAQRSVTHRETVFIDRHYYPRAHPRRGYMYGNRYCYDRFNGYYRPRYC